MTNVAKDQFQIMKDVIAEVDSYLKEKGVGISVDSESTFPSLNIQVGRGYSSGGITEFGAAEPYRGIAPEMYFSASENITDVSRLDNLSLEGDDDQYQQGPMLASTIDNYSGLSFGDIIYVATEVKTSAEMWAGEEDTQTMIECDEEEGISGYIQDSMALVYIGGDKFIRASSLTSKIFNAIRTVAALLNQESNDALGFKTGTIQELLKKEEI